MALFLKAATLMTLAWLTPITYAQSPSSTFQLQMSARRIANAIVSGDYDSVATLTHPRIVEILGGRASFVAAAKAAFSTVPPITEWRFGEPGPVVKLPQGIASVIPYVGKMEAPEGTIVLESINVAWSPDDGATWFFADSNVAYKPGGLELLFPGYRNELTLPKQKPPVLVPR